MTTITSVLGNISLAAPYANSALPLIEKDENFVVALLFGACFVETKLNFLHLCMDFNS